MIFCLEWKIHDQLLHENLAFAAIAKAWPLSGGGSSSCGYRGIDTRNVGIGIADSNSSMTQRTMGMRGGEGTIVACSAGGHWPDIDHDATATIVRSGIAYDGRVVISVTPETTEDEQARASDSVDKPDLDD